MSTEEEQKHLVSLQREYVDNILKEVARVDAMAKINNDINSKTDEVNKVIKQLACLKASLNEMQTKRAHEQERKIVLERLIADVQSDIMTKQAKEQQGYEALSEDLDSPSDKKPLFSGMNIVNGGGNVSTHPRKVKTCSKKVKKVKSSTLLKKQHSVKSVPHSVKSAPRIARTICVAPTVAAAALVPSLFAAEERVTANHETQQVSDSS
jgi:chromosome segregation ATPase